MRSTEGLLVEMFHRDIIWCVPNVLLGCMSCEAISKSRHSCLRAFMFYLDVACCLLSLTAVKKVAASEETLPVVSISEQKCSKENVSVRRTKEKVINAPKSRTVGINALRCPSFQQSSQSGRCSV